ncbi:MAG: LLM class flavin-dependent oxidoreductase [Candidatus Binatus sp.]|jgi:alkanesulfonate monooxygenase SsuD/methylene tetrahydromethanopterin reductase-like flavin-dependent oxidoreductase (luciferase family)
MKFSLTQECQTMTRDYYNRYWQMMREVELADQLGWDSYSLSEQHFTPREYTTSAPEIFLAAAAMRTKRIRLRHGIVLLIKNINHPLKVAERIAMLDIMSNGRIDFGTGRGNKLGTFRAFEVPVDETRHQWEEQLDMIPKMWMQDTFSWESKDYKIPPTSVNPKPVQRPHPPIWTAATSPEVYELAGQKGIGAFCFDFAPPGVTQKHVELYKRTVKHAEPVGGYVNDQAAMLTLGFCAETTEYAKSLAKGPILEFSNEALRIYEELAATKEKSYQYMAQQIAPAKSGVDFDALCDSATVVVGDPDTCIKKLKLYQEAGADEIIIRMDGMPHEKIMDSIRLFAEYVMPEFRN